MGSKSLFIVLIFLSVFLVQCTKPTTIGGDLVNASELNFGSTDTLPIKVTTIKSTDSLRSFIYSSLPFALSRYYLGQLEDPVFGLNTAEIIAQYGPYPGTYASTFAGATVDSVVLTLILDSSGFYGDNAAMQSLAVARLSDPLRLDTSFYTFQDFATEPGLVGEMTNFVPNLSKRMLVITPDSSVIDTNSAYLRIPLDNSLGQEILAYDSLDFAEVNNFAEKFRGIKIYSSTSSPSMMAVKLDATYSEIDIYYHTATEDSLVFPIHALSGYSATDRQTQDYTGSFVEPYIGSENDSLFFMQSMGGLNLEVNLPDLSSLGNIIVNKAILEFTLESLSFDDTLVYKGLSQVILKDTSNAFVLDVSQVLNIGGGLPVFGGKPKIVVRDGEAREVVQMNISSLMQEVYYGNVSNKVLVKPTLEISQLGRFVIQGFTGDKKWQPKLYLNYTNQN